MGDEQRCPECNRVVQPDETWHASEMTKGGHCQVVCESCYRFRNMTFYCGTNNEAKQ